MTLPSDLHLTRVPYGVTQRTDERLTENRLRAMYDSVGEPVKLTPVTRLMLIVAMEKRGLKYAMTQNEGWPEEQQIAWYHGRGETVGLCGDGGIILHVTNEAGYWHRNYAETSWYREVMDL